MPRESAAVVTKRSPDQETMFNTWHSVVKEYNRRQEIIDGKPLRGCRKDGGFSWTWAQQMCKDLGLVTTTSGSAEDKLPKPEDCERFEREAPALFEEQGIDPRAHLAFDEFNDFMDLRPKKVVLRKKEDQKPGPEGNQKKHVPSRQNARVTVSGGYLPIPTWIGEALVIADSGSQETLGLVKQELGNRVKVIQKQTRSACGLAHAREFLRIIWAKRACG